MDAKNPAMETEICHNCKREVPQANYLMHVAHCARNMAICPVCGDAVPKAHLKEHRQKEHAMVECKDCRFKLQSGAMEQHKKTSCGKRVVACQYCELELPHCEIKDHEYHCGARTERCNDCGEIVMLKYQKLHLDSNHGFLKLDDEPGPTASWETPTPPTTRNITTRNSFAELNSLNSALPITRPVERNTERNVNNSPIAEVTCKTDYKAPMVNSEPLRESLRDAPRMLVTPYDASEDLRAKVKLARHDLNEIKNSYLTNEDRKTRYDHKYRNDRYDHLNLTATQKKTAEKFVTNLVPFEKNKSCQVNAMPLDEKPKNYYNYLGAKETPPANMVPAKEVINQRNLFQEPTNGQSEKYVKKPNLNLNSKEESQIHKNDENRGIVKPTGALPKKPSQSPTNGATPKRELGAVPRSTRRKAPPPPVQIPKHAPQSAPRPPSPQLPASLNEVTLPCEFCEKMVPATQLVQHETGCRPDLAQIQSAKQTPPVACPNLSPEVQLPCEFCFTLIPMSKLLSHQALCDV